MQDPRIQELKTAHLELRKLINDLLEAHSAKSTENNPRLTLSEAFAISAELDETLDLLHDEMHDIAETLEMRGVGLLSNLLKLGLKIEAMTERGVKLENW